MLANKFFLLNLYAAKNKMQAVSVLTQGTKEELDCLFHVLVCIQKGEIPVKSAKRLKKKLHKLNEIQNQLETMAKTNQFRILLKFAGHFNSLLAPLFKMPK